MTFQEYLDSRGITKYRLSQLSGVPKTTINDICAGRSLLSKCSAKTILLLAKALDCSMEDIMKLDEADPHYDEKTGLPKDDSYLEKDLPPFLQASIAQMAATWERIDRGEKDMHWDLDWGELNADINAAEVEQVISSEQAWHLRVKYLRMERRTDI